jgi:splicing factor 1
VIFILAFSHKVRWLLTFVSPSHHQRTSQLTHLIISMAWRANQSQTGSNNIPLGNRRRFGGDDEGTTPPRNEQRGRERSRSPARGMFNNSISHPGRLDSQVLAKPDPDGQRVRKRRNRWGPADENKAAGLMGLPTAILSNMTQEQKEAYVLHLRIEEISQKLRIDDVVPSDNRYVDLPFTSSSRTN